MCDMSWVSHKKAEKRGELFCPIFRNHYFLVWNYTKRFVSYPVNDIEAYKYNILMTLQSAIASTVTVIAEILVWIVVRLPIGLSPAL